MKINNYHPKYDLFIRNEIKTLGFLSGFTQIQNLANGLYEEICNKYAFYRSKEQNINNIEFSIGSHFDLVIENNIYHIIIEGIVKPNFTESSYAFSICKKNIDESLELVRKYHFDYAISNTSDDRKALYHLQYGGESTPILTSLNIPVDALHPYLSPPRLEMVPMNFAILLDNVFCECYSFETRRLIESSEWRQLIKSNEEFLYKAYFKNINDFFQQNHHKSKFLYRDLRHGKTE